MIRPLRQCVALRNISASQDVNGYVRVLHTNHPMNFAIGDYTLAGGARVRISADKHAAFREMIDQHLSTRTVHLHGAPRWGFRYPLFPGPCPTYNEYHERVDLPP